MTPADVKDNLKLRYQFGASPHSDLNQPASHQEFAHGRFQWLHYPDELANDGLLVARVTIHPGATWPEHIHSGYEQLMQVISGSGYHTVDGKHKELFNGTTCFLPLGSRHVMVNTGSEPLVHISVYHPRKPAAVRELALTVQDQYGTRPAPEWTALPAGTMAGILKKFATAVNLGVVAITREGTVLSEPTGLPALCCQLRQVGACDDCPAFDAATGHIAHEHGRPVQFDCPLGVVGVAVPLLADERWAGHLACGFIRLEESLPHARNALKAMASAHGLVPNTLWDLHDQVEVVLQAQMMAAAESLESIANSIVSLSMRERQRRQEGEHAAAMLKKLQLVSQLEYELQEAQFRALEASINPHFLFNALNIIAEAVAAGDKKGEEIVYALADFLRFSFAHGKSVASLQEEVNGLRSYLAVQHARFGQDLACDITLETGSERCLVPFMILQPLVENAIIHGLAPKGYAGTIHISARLTDQRLLVSVVDDGVGIDQDKVLDLPQPREALGLRYIRTKLQHTFGDDHQLRIESQEGKGTAVHLDLPQKEATKDADPLAHSHR